MNRKIHELPKMSLISFEIAPVSLGEVERSCNIKAPVISGRSDGSYVEAFPLCNSVLYRIIVPQSGLGILYYKVRVTYRNKKSKREYIYFRTQLCDQQHRAFFQTPNIQRCGEIQVDLLPQFR